MKYIVSLLLATVTLTAAAINPFSRLALYDRTTTTETRSEAESFIPVIIELNVEATAAPLEALGVRILRHRENFLLAYVPSAVADEVVRLSGIKDITLDKGSVINLSKARAFSRVDEIHAGYNLPHGYSGRGVVVGICDIGFDPSHPTFDSRIKRLVCYREEEGARDLYDSPEEISAFVTDNQDNWHATHVAGILAGADDSAGLRGVAPEADIVVTLSTLTNVGLLAGAEDIIEYARSVGKPAVINMSVGSYVGPHDGSTLFNAYLDLLGREALVCLSAGNEGAHENALDATFSDAFPSTGVQIVGTDWVFFKHEGGLVDVWSTDDAPVEICLGIWDEDLRQPVYRLPFRVLDENIWGITSEGEDDVLTYDAEFASKFVGRIYATAGVDSRNGRWNATFRFDTETSIKSSNGGWSRYRPWLEFRGEKGRRVLVFADGLDTSLQYKLDGKTVRATTDWSVSDLACGENLLCVGMYTTSAQTVMLDGRVVDYPKLSVGTVNRASGYGTLLDGRVLPTVCAPGSMIVSACSNPYLEANSDFADLAEKSVTSDGTWYWAPNGGTSMSSPFTAGVLALWLEANPDLTISDVKNILSRTNIRQYDDAENPRNGLGWLNAVDGLRLALDPNGLENITTDRPRIEYRSGTLTVVNPTDAPICVEIFNLSGMSVKSFNAPAGSTSVPLSLPPGIYLVSASGYTCKIAV